MVYSRCVVYYSNVNADQTKSLASQLSDLKDQVPIGWGGVMAFDPDGTGYLLLSNFTSSQKCTLADVNTSHGAPVFTVKTTISGPGSSASFVAEENHSVSDVLRFFIKGTGLEAIQQEGHPDAIFLLNLVKGNNKLTINAFDNGKALTKEVVLHTSVLKVSICGGELLVEEADMFPEDTTEDLTRGYSDITDQLKNPSFEEDVTYGDRGTNVTASGVTYSDCYINKVSPSNSKWPNILPVKGWTTGNKLSSGSNYARMYSMPYSMDLFCVSPSNVGNYAAQTAGMMSDDEKGDRTLTVLNSWDKGSNAITQTVFLQPGDYRVLLNMKYECTNQQSNDGRRVVASGNTNTSLTGVKIGTKTDYRYPAEPNTWETMVYDFTLDQAQDITLSLGYQTSAGVGAANNTLLYIDHVRVLQKIPSNIDQTLLHQQPVWGDGAVYDLMGRQTSSDQMPHTGIYIQNGRKVMKNKK